MSGRPFMSSNSLPEASPTAFRSFSAMEHVNRTSGVDDEESFSSSPVSDYTTTSLTHLNLSDRDEMTPLASGIFVNDDTTMFDTQETVTTVLSRGSSTPVDSDDDDEDLSEPFDNNTRGAPGSSGTVAIPPRSRGLPHYHPSMRRAHTAPSFGRKPRHGVMVPSHRMKDLVPSSSSLNELTLRPYGDEDRLTTLPDSLLILILTQYLSFRDVGTCLALCRRMHSISHNGMLWKELCRFSFLGFNIDDKYCPVVDARRRLSPYVDKRLQTTNPSSEESDEWRAVSQGLHFDEEAATPTKYTSGRPYRSLGERRNAHDKATRRQRWKESVRASFGDSFSTDFTPGTSPTPPKYHGGRKRGHNVKSGSSSPDTRKSLDQVSLVRMSTEDINTSAAVANEDFHGSHSPTISYPRNWSADNKKHDIVGGSAVGDVPSRRRSSAGGRALSYEFWSSSFRTKISGRQLGRNTRSALNSKMQSLCMESHENRISTLKMDCSKIVSGGADCIIRIFSAKTLARLGTIQDHRSGVNSLDWNDRLIVSGASNGSVMVHDWDNLSRCHSLRGHTGAVFKVLSMPIMDSRCITSGLDRTIKVWDVEVGRCLTTLGDNQSRSLGPITELHAYSDSSPTMFFSGGLGGTLGSNANEFVGVWDLRSPSALVGTLPMSVRCSSLAIHSGNLIVGGIDGTVQFYDNRKLSLPISSEILSSSIPRSAVATDLNHPVLAGATAEGDDGGDESASNNLGGTGFMHDPARDREAREARELAAANNRGLRADEPAAPPAPTYHPSISSIAGVDSSTVAVLTSGQLSFMTTESLFGGNGDSVGAVEGFDGSTSPLSYSSLVSDSLYQAAVSKYATVVDQVSIDHFNDRISLNKSGRPSSSGRRRPGLQGQMKCMDYDRKSGRMVVSLQNHLILYSPFGGLGADVLSLDDSPHVEEVKASGRHDKRSSSVDLGSFPSQNQSSSSNSKQDRRRDRKDKKRVRKGYRASGRR